MVGTDTVDGGRDGSGGEVVSAAEILLKAAAEIRADVAALPEQSETAVRVKPVVINGRRHLTWDPAVALSLASWLHDCGSAPGWEVADLAWLFDDALTIATAYLGTSHEAAAR